MTAIMNNTTNDDRSIPPAAPISFAIAAIPAEPVHSAVARASKAIAKRYANRNVIDNVTFPCHLSLVLGGTSANGLDYLATLLRSLSFDDVSHARAVAVHAGDRGFISVALANTVNALQERALSATKLLMNQHMYIRPHLAERWPRLTAEERRLLLSNGTYKVGPRFKPHLSVAQVGVEDAPDALDLARRHIATPIDTRFIALQVVDVGHKNEQWRIHTVIQIS